MSSAEATKLVTTRNSAPYTTVAPGWICNQDDGRWGAGFDPTRQNEPMTCTAAGTRLDPSAHGVLKFDEVFLNFENSAFGGLPDAFDYSFDATFEGANAGQCIEMYTSSYVTPERLVYAYVFIICSNGTGALEFVGYHKEDFKFFLMKELTSGPLDLQTTNTIQVEVRPTITHLYINHQLITSYEAPSELLPSIYFTNANGPVLYSNFSYVPRTQQ